jgi:hypothetical protein
MFGKGQPAKRFDPMRQFLALTAIVVRDYDEASASQRRRAMELLRFSEMYMAIYGI